MNMNPKVDGYLRKSGKWREELRKLRAIVLDCDLTEEMKWRAPCYTLNNHNILFIGRLKECCVLSFVKGALLKDAARILVRPGERTRVVRVIRFTNLQQIIELEPTLKAYIQEAIEVEKSGLKPDIKKNPEPIPQELQNKFEEIPRLKAAFAALTPGRRRAYILYFSRAKQSKTREARVEKCRQQILEGKGLDD